MATTFPTSLQDLDATRGISGDKLNNLTKNHITHHTHEDDTIEALQAKVGVDSSAVTTSHSYKLSEVTGTDVAVGKTATQTLTNKTLTSPTINTPTITTPTIADFTNAAHDHGDADDGGAIGAAAIPSGSITNAKLSTAAGEIGAAWQSWSPTWDNLTISSSTVDARYIQIGKTVHFEISVVGAGSFDITGAPVQFTAPVTIAASTIQDDPVGFGNCQESVGGAFYLVQAWRGNANTKIRLLVFDVSTYVRFQDMTTTVPFDWDAGDRIKVCGAYEAA